MELHQRSNEISLLHWIDYHFVLSKWGQFIDVKYIKTDLLSELIVCAYAKGHIYDGGNVIINGFHPIYFFW